MNKKRSNEYGFTLVELLVAIAIMLSITVLAIVNIVGVSNRKKEEAWQSVKEEIETAATDYFKYNEYLFEGLGENENDGYISVGKLVNDDYLNKVTDPRTGKAVSYCTLVYIKKSGRSVSVTKIEESASISCDYESVVTVSNAKNAPKLKVEKRCGEDGKNHWCIGNTKPKAEATATPVNGSEVISIEKDNNTGSNYKCDANLTSSNNDKKKSCTLQKETKEGITLIAKSADGGITKSSIDIGYDNTKPVIKLNIDSKNSEYNTSSVDAKLKITEDGSGVASVSSTPREMETNKEMFSGKNTDQKKKDFKLLDYGTKDKKSSQKVTVTVVDVAGNIGEESVTYTAYSICTKTQDGEKLTKSDKCPKCSNNPVSLKVTNEQQLLDKYFNNEKCETKTLPDSIYECKNLPPCSRTCPTLWYGGDDPMKDSKGNYWYTKASIQYIDNDPAYWTWYLNGREYKDCKNEKTCYFDVLDEHTVTIKGKNNEKCEDQPIRVYKKLICGIDGKKGDINVEKVEYGKFEKIKIIVSDDVESFKYSVGSKSGTSEASQLVIDEGLDSNTSYKITAKNSQGFTYECSGTISLKVPPKPDCSSSKIVVESGTKGDNGWYKEKDIKLKIKNKKSDLNYSFVTSQGETGSSTLTITKEGTSTVTLKAQNTYGVSTTCDTATYKLDKTPPKLVADNFDNYDRNIKQYKGDGKSNQIFDGTLKTKNLCLINIGGGYEPPTPSFTFSDDVSGVETTSYNNPFPGANRWCTPIRVRYQFTAKDIAGNVKTVNSSNIFTVSYILSGSRNFYNPCSVSNYATQYSNISLEKRDGETLEPKNATCYSTNNNWVQYDTNRREPSW